MGRGYSGERWSDGHGVPSTGNDISRSLSLRDIGTDSVERTEQNGHRGLESEVGLSPETASCASGGALPALWGPDFSSGQQGEFEEL